jgi:cytochrome c oxidase assembly factor CtaG
MCELTLVVSHPHRRRTGGSRGATQRGVRLDLGGVSQLTLWHQRWTLVRFIFIFYFVRLPLCNKYFNDIVTFISIHSVIICVVFFSAYMRCTRLCPLNPGVTEVVSEKC